ncbi:lysophospholipase [Clostridium sp. ZBS12]
MNSSDRTLKIYDGLYHEILNEPDRNYIIDNIS